MPKASGRSETPECPHQAGPPTAPQGGCAHTLIIYSMRLWECFSITDSIHIKGLTCHREGRQCSHLVISQSLFHRGETEAQGMRPCAQVCARLWKSPQPEPGRVGAQRGSWQSRASGKVWHHTARSGGAAWEEAVAPRPGLSEALPWASP